MRVRECFTFTLEIHDHMLILWIGGIYHTFDKIHVRVFFCYLWLVLGALLALTSAYASPLHQHRKHGEFFEKYNRTTYSKLWFKSTNQIFENRDPSLVVNCCFWSNSLLFPGGSPARLWSVTVSPVPLDLLGENRAQLPHHLPVRSIIKKNQSKNRTNQRAPNQSR